MTINDHDLTEVGIADLIRIWQRLVDQLKEEEQVYEKNCKPFKTLLQKVKGEVATRLDKEGISNVKTPFGTAYFYNVQRIKVVDRDVFFAWVIDTRCTSVLTTNLSKDALKELAQLPPGVDVTESFRDIRLRE